MTHPKMDMAEISDEDFFEAFIALGMHADGTQPLQTAGPKEVSQNDWAALVARQRAMLARDPEDCANIMIEYAEVNDDPHAWKFVGAILDDYLSRGKIPPLTLLRGLNAALKRWRGGESIAVVFGEKSGPARPGRRKAGFKKTAWARTNATLMAYWVERGFSDEVAAQKVVDMRSNMSPTGDTEDSSVSAVKRAYKKFFKK